MRVTLFTIFLFSSATFSFSFAQSAQNYRENAFSTAKKVRVTDGIGKGLSKEIAMQNAIVNARQKALTRVTSTFRHVLSETQDGEFVKKSVAQEVNAKIIEKEEIISVNYDHGMNFEPYYVAIVDCIVTVSFLDLDFFATEIMKTAEAACIRSIVLSGWGQVFNRSYFAGAAFGLVTYSSLGYGYYREQQISDAQKAYNTAIGTANEEQALRTLQGHQNASRILYAAGAMTWAYSVWDAFEDRERVDEIMDEVHKVYFPQYPYERQYSYFQEFIMETTRPTW